MLLVSAFGIPAALGLYLMYRGMAGVVEERPTLPPGLAAGAVRALAALTFVAGLILLVAAVAGAAELAESSGQLLDALQGG